jgi:hypothetical protein
MKRILASAVKFPKRYPVPLLVLAGVLLYLPSLDNGFNPEDVYQLALMERVSFLPEVGPLSLYSFPEDRSILPWWTTADFRWNFWRPFCCVFHQLDHGLWGREPVGFHGTNLLLWTLVMVSVLLYYRRLAGASKQGSAMILIAGLFFVLDEAHARTIYWIANRCYLLATAASVGSLLLYHRYRTDGKIRNLFGSLVLVMLGLLAYESTAGVVFWVAAYELCLSKDRISKRIGSAAVIVLPIVAYMTVYRLMGYGGEGAQYLNPFGQPLQFLAEGLLIRLPFYLLGALTPANAAHYRQFLVSGELWHLFLTWAVVLLAALPLITSLRRSPINRFMALGTLGSILLMFTAVPDDRLLLFPTVGSAWVLASFVLKAWRRRWFWKVTAAIVFIIHGLVAPLQTEIRVASDKTRIDKYWQAALKSEMPGPGEAERARVLLITSTPNGMFFPLLRWTKDLPYPEAVLVVTAGRGEFAISRTGVNSLSVKILWPDFPQELGGVMTGDEPDFNEGDRFQQGDMEVTIVDAVDGKIREFEVTIDRPLDHPDVWLLSWTGERFVRVQSLPWK